MRARQEELALVAHFVGFDNGAVPLDCWGATRAGGELSLALLSHGIGDPWLPADSGYLSILSNSTIRMNRRTGIACG